MSSRLVHVMGSFSLTKLRLYAWLGVLLFCLAAWINLSPKLIAKEIRGKDSPEVDRWKIESIEGWQVGVSKRFSEVDQPAVDATRKVLSTQLKELQGIGIPEVTLRRLQQVPMWISPEYPRIVPRAEYHPSAQWLTDNHRDPIMARGIEWTNTRIIDQEARRMPSMVLHELAHAYHDQELGYDDPDAIHHFQRAQAGGRYEAVERRDAEGAVTSGAAYAISNVQEFFAESTESFLGRNDYFPYNRSELERFDPATARWMRKVWTEGRQVPLSEGKE
jgi:dipeptidyl-peptidase-4